MGPRREQEVEDDPRDWAPMRPAIVRRPRPISDPIIEPLWSGRRVIAHIGLPSGPDGTTPASGGRRAGDPAVVAAGDLRRAVALIDELGLDAADDVPGLAAELAEALLAEDAVIDAIISPQALLGGEGAAIVGEAAVSFGRVLFSGAAEVDVRRRDQGPRPRLVEPGIVCVDLLVVDGQELLDVPLLERKRLLESVVRVGGSIRVSVHARPPLETWVATWKSLGLRGAMLKAANSRYHPGERTLEWRAVERIAARG